MLFALLDGGELAASELAARAQASPAAASAHLARLVAGGLLTVEARGRQRFFRLASGEVGHALEALAAITGPRPIVALTQARTTARMRIARSCYDHLAGRLGVALTDALVARRVLRLSNGELHITRNGADFLARLNLDAAPQASSQRPPIRTCADWTERRPHVAGALGAALLARALADGWVTRTRTDRSLRITDAGRLAFARHFDVVVNEEA